MNLKMIKPEIKEIVGLADDALKNPKGYSALAGVSLGTSHYTSKQNRKLYLDFLVRYFNKILLFINDYNYHWDLMAFRLSGNKNLEDTTISSNFMNKREALDKAEKMGKEVEEMYKLTIKKHFQEDSKRIKIVKFFDLLNERSYQNFFQHFTRILNENPEIYSEIDSDLDNQIRKTEFVKDKLEKIKKFCPEHYEDSIRFTKNYVLEQLIANLYLMFKSPIVYNIRVSLTPYSQFVTFKKFLEGGYNNFKRRSGLNYPYGVISGIGLTD